jgi:hypothetical protein
MCEYFSSATCSAHFRSESLHFVLNFLHDMKKAWKNQYIYLTQDLVYYYDDVFAIQMKGGPNCTILYYLWWYELPKNNTIICYYYNNIKKNTAAFANIKTQGIEFDYDNQLIYT